MSFNIAISGGGTGGHIMPAISIYDEFKSHNYKVYLLFGKRDKQYDFLNDIEESYFYNAASRWKNIFEIPLFLYRFVSSIIWSYNFINKNKIDSIIGMGGYVSAPSLVAAMIKKIPIYLCEQNVIPGKVTKFFSKYARNIFVTFDSSKEFFDDEIKHKIIHTGNPLRKIVLNKIEKNVAIKKFNMEHCKKILLVIGGSQGALQINNIVYEVLQKYPEAFADIGIIWSTGEYSYELFKNKLQHLKHQASIYLTPYIKDVNFAYAASDLAISRAGAGVLMELAYWGLPSVLIPYPYAADNHQKYNAIEFEKNGAAIMIESNKMDIDKISQTLFNILENNRLISKMKNNAKKLSIENAANKIFKNIKNDMMKRRNGSV